MSVKQHIELADFENSVHSISGLTKYFDNVTIIILGANGIIGSNLAYSFYYLRKNYNITLRLQLVIRSKPSERLSMIMDEDWIDIFQCDITNFPFELPISGEFVVFHAASQASPKYYNTDPIGTILANSIGTYNILEFSKNTFCKAFLFISAGEVYGKMETNTVTESLFGPLDPMQLRSCYGEGKRCGEALCNAYHHQYGLNTYVARLFHTYGPGMRLDDSRIFADITRDILTERRIILHSDGSAVRCFAYISDVVNALLRILIHGKPGIAYNVANVSQTMSIKELSERLSFAFDLNDSPSYTNLIASNYSVSPYASLIPDISKITSIGWQPLLTVEQGFQRSINWFSNSILY